ncbi:hypothetical protein NA57DRAFT_62952 [Rhizodiscina lignyota]|uniref:2-hydroxyacyl-CoA lyase n=1 Tax=Rhizodiscina lignyota TaxID=1504668 RepID=A0A9P4ITW6_9PEZI|nr:hypothetical protein NA57DRAFT_62952 [Rhizodiscina lignyota]
MATPTGEKIIAQALRDLGVTVVFGLVGLPVAGIAEEVINLGIRFVAFRNEQAASYAATAYGYLRGKPGVCLLVGGPGMLHGIAGIGNASENGFPTLFLGGASERDLDTKGAFQEMKTVPLLTPHTKSAVRPSSNQPDVIVDAIYNAYRICAFGRPGPTFVDLPADLIMNAQPEGTKARPRAMIQAPPRPAAEQDLIVKASNLLKSAKAPLVIVGKGAALARAEGPINDLIASANLPFLPTPMGKGVVPDSSPLNTSSARSAALKEADVVLLLGGRLNWILHYGAAPKFRSDVKIIQVDISAEALGHTNSAGHPSLSILADIAVAVQQLNTALRGWNSYAGKLSTAAARNEQKNRVLELSPTESGAHMTYQRVYYIIRSVFNSFSTSSKGTNDSVVLVSEGAATMDISRSSFPLSLPRHRLDAGTYATMGVGMGYAIAAWAAYNYPHPEDSGNAQRKKIVAVEGDSAFGFSGMEIETMARCGMDVLIIVMNNSGIYHGDAKTANEWDEMRKQTLAGGQGIKKNKRLSATSLTYNTRYEKMAEMVDGRGWFVQTEAELENAVREAYQERQKVCLVNVVVEPGLDNPVNFAWESKQPKQEEAKL